MDSICVAMGKKSGKAKKQGARAPNAKDLKPQTAAVGENNGNDDTVENEESLTEKPFEQIELNDDNEEVKGTESQGNVEDSAEMAAVEANLSKAKISEEDAQLGNEDTPDLIGSIPPVPEDSIEDGSELNPDSAPEIAMDREPSKDESDDVDIIQASHATESKQLVVETSTDAAVEELNEDEHYKNEDSNDNDHNELPEEDDDDDDFGSFDEASFEELEFTEPEPAQPLHAEFSTAVLENTEVFQKNLEAVLERILPIEETITNAAKEPLLNETALERLHKFSTLPRLNPPNWTKLKMRHELLLSLGVPINLDELDSAHSSGLSAKIVAAKRRSITENDIQWGDFNIPDIDALDISAERKLQLMEETHQILSAIEDDNLNNTTELFLLQSAEHVVDEKLRQMQSNHARLVELTAIWLAQIKELRNSQEMFESVVQNMVGYRQKLQRNEILERLSKTKRGKRVF